jgi:hypothetical protein
MSTSQPRRSQVLGRHPEDGGSEELEDYFRSTWKCTVLSYEELGGLLDPRPRDCAHEIEYSRIRDGACLIPYICCKVLGYK